MPGLFRAAKRANRQFRGLQTAIPEQKRQLRGRNRQFPTKEQFVEPEC